MDRMTNCTLCIAGKNQIAIVGLKYALKRFKKDDILVLCNSTDEGVDTWQPSLRKFATGNGVKIVSLDECYDNRDLIFLSLEYDKIIKPEKFRTTQLYNVHFSALPAYKGMYTSALPILKGERESGVTLHRIDAGIDTGAIIDQIKFDIGQHDCAHDLYLKYLQFGERLVGANFDSMMAGSVAAVEQSSRGSTYFSKSSIDYGSLAVDLNCTAYQIKNQIRAFTFPVYQVPEVVGVRAAAADILPNKSSVPAGEVLSKTPRYVDVSTIDYDLRLYRCPTAELMDAAREDDSKSASVCMELGADINFRNYRGWSPLIIASYVGASKVIKALVSKGVDVNLPNFKGTTPLMYAMSCFEASGDSQPVELLLEAGADTSILDGRGKCLADYAVERGVKMFF